MGCFFHTTFLRWPRGIGLLAKEVQLLCGLGGMAPAKILYLAAGLLA